MDHDKAKVLALTFLCCFCLVVWLGQAQGVHECATLLQCMWKVSIIAVTSTDLVLAVIVALQRVQQQILGSLMKCAG